MPRRPSSANIPGGDGGKGLEGAEYFEFRSQRIRKPKLNMHKIIESLRNLVIRRTMSAAIRHRAIKAPPWLCLAVLACFAPLLAMANPPPTYSRLPAANVVYLRSTSGQPWGLPDFDLALTTVFGPGWQDLRYETVSPAALFATTNKFIFMEGGADSGPPMGTFLTNNLPAVSNWVANGGSLFVNVALLPGATFPMYLGFGATAALGDTSDTVGAMNPSHPIFNGPSLPVGGAFTGNFFGHSTITGVGLGGMLSNTPAGRIVLSERNYGPGHLIFGGMTSPHFWLPQPQATNLLYNILAYAGNLAAIPPSSRVAIYGAPSTLTWNNDVSNKVMNTFLFNQVDANLVIPGEPVPTLAQLQNYGAVLVYSDQSLNDPNALGNVLADYVDSGGGVVMATFDFDSGYGPLGRLGSGGYLPLTTSNSTSGSVYSLVADQPSHPILNGVSSFNGGTSSYHNSPISPTPGASLIAHWTDGQPLVATKQRTAGRMAALNFYPPSSDSRSDFWPTNTDGTKLLANALLWTVNAGTTNLFTTNSWNGTNMVSPFGEPGTATYGQTFVAPSATPILTSFKLYFTNLIGTVTFRFYVMAWSGTNATGPILFQSPVTTLAATSGFQPITFNTSQLSLTPGRSYVAFVSTSTVQDGGTKTSGLGITATDVYPGGYFVYFANGTDFSQLTTSAWSAFTGLDLAFVATFSGGVSPIPPGIVTQPVGQVVLPGANAVFSTIASGSTTLSYQWKFNGTNLTDNVQFSGSHTSTLAISNASPANAGYYSVTVSNSLGSTNSQLALLTVLPPLTVAISPPENVDEYNAIYSTLTNLGFNVVTVSNGQWAGVNVIVSYPGCDPLQYGPGFNQISNGFSFVEISDWGFDWTPKSYVTLIKGTNLTISVGAPHPITAGLPASWTAHGIWRYGDPTGDYLVYGTDASQTSLASEISVTGKSRVLVATNFDRGRAVFIGWNVYGPDAGSNDIAVLRNAILWAGQANPPLIFLTALLSETGGTLNFTWTAVPTYSYQVQYKTNLAQPAWLNLGSPITATGPTVTSSDSLASSNRVYRVKLLP